MLKIKKIKTVFPTTNRRGFTLLELLVVIAIIGILFSVAVASFSTAQKKARDAKRREDMKAIQNALEQYYAANSGYPGSCFSSGDSLTIDDKGTPETSDDDIFIFPTDPRNDGVSGYVYQGSPPCSSSGYCYCAQLEETTGNANNNACHFASGGQYFCVKNLQ